MTKRFFAKCFLLCWASTTLLLTACVMHWQKPEVSLIDVQPAGGTLFEQRLKLKLRVYNPNDRDIPVDSLHFRFVSGDKSFASGQTSAPVVIPRQGETVVDIQANMQLANLIRNLPNLKAEDGKLHYRLQGDVVVHDYGSVPFDHPGVLDLDMFEGRKHTSKGESAASSPQ
ncbi:LEA type 2 family protein [Uliginosibacterium gangwonense]|uniref:LEA type 2 family protein n=1 Tax=Uliginosibacterium gangwonense TaxID=392736 RepID=UPI00036825B8|nr:LEA type 2 family protein [Uliginosibacterium gangwonense]